MSKHEFTKLIIAEAELEITFEQAMKVWWFTPSEDNYRLTYHGYKTLKELAPSFEFGFSGLMNGKTLLQLGKLNCAYFLVNKGTDQKIHIFSTKIATVIRLYGDFSIYLNTLK